MVGTKLCRRWVVESGRLLSWLGECRHSPLALGIAYGLLILVEEEVVYPVVVVLETMACVIYSSRIVEGGG